MDLSISNRNRCLSIVLSLAVVCAFGAVGIAADDAKKDEKAKPAEATKDVKIDDITLKVPESWKQQEPTSNSRKAQFKIEKVEGDSESAELAVFFFGGSGGGVDANLKRWVSQFQDKERKAKITQGESPQGKYVFADITGTYNMPIGPIVQQKTKPLPGARMLGVILSVEGKGNYFLKLTGPEKTVAAAAKAFRDSFGADASKEKELKLDE
ncbi:MAG: hypothetical protein WD648_15230 [Planctomycetaceae bacterium]